MLARFVLGAVAAGAMIAPRIRWNDERRRGPPVRVRQGVRVHLLRRHPRRGPDPRRHGRDGCGAVFRRRSDPPSPAARQYASDSRLRRCAPRSRAFRSSRASISTRQDEVSFRGSVSGMGFAYCDFHHQGAAQMLMARAVARPRSRRMEATAARSYRAPKFRRGWRPRRSRARGSIRSNRKPRPSLRRSSPRSRKALRNCAVRLSDMVRSVIRRAEVAIVFDSITNLVRVFARFSRILRVICGERAGRC